MKKIFALLCVSALTFSCVEDTVLPGDDMASGKKVVGFQENLTSISYFSDLGDKEHEYPVNLIGLGNGQYSSKDIVVSYEADPTVANSATEGLEYDFTDAAKMATIPAGTTFGMIPITVHTGSLNPSGKTVLRIRLTATTTSGVAVSSNYGYFDIIFIGCQSGLQATYNVQTTRNDTQAIYNFANEDVVMGDVNTFRTGSVGPYTAGSLDPSATNGYTFIDICGVIQVPEQNLGNVYSNIVKGMTEDGTDGSVSGNNFTVSYQIGFTSNTVWRPYTSVYTRL